MDSLQNMKALLMVSRTGSFVAAAQRLGVAPSVVTKRVNQLEWQLRAPLLHRTTRKVWLTELGERHLAKIQRIIQDYEQLAAGMLDSPELLEGHLRISAPAAFTTQLLCDPLVTFRAAHPGVTVEVVVMDRSVNPVEEGFDLSLVVLSATYERVVEEVIGSYPRIACASPAYLSEHGTPQSPRDLAHHRCIAFSPVGPVWTFQGPTGEIKVDIRPGLTANDSRVVGELICQGAGIGMLSLPTIRDVLASGRLVPILTDYVTPDLSLKAFVPESRHHLARIRAFIAHLRDRFRDGYPHTEPAIVSNSETVQAH